MKYLCQVKSTTFCRDAFLYKSKQTVVELSCLVYYLIKSNEHCLKIIVCLVLNNYTTYVAQVHQLLCLLMFLAR